MAPAPKRQKLYLGIEDKVEDRNVDSLPESGSDDGSSEAEMSEDTEEEIEHAKLKKSSKTLKRKHRATDATRFGDTLQHLLNTQTPSTLPLSLKPSVVRKHHEEKLESQGRKVLLLERKEKEEKGRLRDVIGGWGGESERALRKVAQRGVVKLFNVIQQSQAAASSAADRRKAERGSGRPTLPAPQLDRRKAKKDKHKDNLLGQNKKETSSVFGQGDFLESIRSGGVVSKI